MKAPAFWLQPHSVWGQLLAPLGWVYAETTARRLAHARPWRAPVPVVCVGNLTAGGAGKTPVTRDLVRRLTQQDWRPSVLSRGYGGQARDPTRVDPTRHAAQEVGDEPLLLSVEAPCWVGPDRRESARAALAEGAGVLVLDDGLQNPALAQDLRLVVVDGPVGFGNGRAIPAGPLRERIDDGLRRADAVVLIGPDRQNITARVPGHLPVLRAQLALQDAAALRGRRLVAFCGIGRPDKFRDSLRDADADVVSFGAFPDHHLYSEAELSEAAALAARRSADLVTTEKDWVRLSPIWRGRIKALPVKLAWQDETQLLPLFDRLRDHG